MQGANPLAGCARLIKVLIDDGFAAAKRYR